MYNVVFEYGLSMPKIYGCRFFVSYESKEVFEARNNKDDGTEVVAEGISEEDAQDLVALTPEVCILLQILEDAFQGINSPDHARTQWAFDNARAAIYMYREHIALRRLSRQVATKYVAHHMSNLRFDKHFLAPSKRIILATVDKFDGQIDILP